MKSKSQFLPQSTVSGRSHSSPEANSNYCHILNAWSHLVDGGIIRIDNNIINSIIAKVINVKKEKCTTKWFRNRIFTNATKIQKFKIK